MLVDLLDLLLLEELPVDLLGDLRGNLRVLGDVLGDLRVLDLLERVLGDVLGDLLVLDLAAKTLPHGLVTQFTDELLVDMCHTCARIWL